MRPTDYQPRSIARAVQAYGTMQRECLSIVWEVLLLRPFVEGTKFTIHTSCVSFCRLLHLANATAGLVWWRLNLPKFDSGVKNCSGLKYRAVDSLFWLPKEDVHSSLLQDKLYVLLMEHDNPIDDSSCSVYAVEANINMCEHSVSAVGKTERSMPTLAKPQMSTVWPPPYECMRSALRLRPIKQAS